MNATEKRTMALSAIIRKYLPESTGYTLVEGTTREQVAEDFDALVKLGRTEKWQNQCKRFAEIARTDMSYDLDWVVRQGVISCGWYA